MLHNGQHPLYGQSATTATVTIADPAGDSCVYPEAPSYPDITTMTATKSGNSVTFSIAYTGTFGYGTISLDTDQNPATGNAVPELQLCLIEIPGDGVLAQSSDTTVPPPEPPSPPSFSLLGEDYVISFFNDGTATLNRWDLAGTPPGDAFLQPIHVADLPMVQTPTTVEIVLDLALVGGDDGNIDFLADMVLDLQGSDRIPNFGHGTLTVAVDITPPVITVTSPWDGQIVESDDRITFDFTAADPESGVTSLTAMVDTTVVTSGSTVLARNFGTGIHYLTVLATNGAGLITLSTVSFEVQPTLTDIVYDVADCRTRGEMSAGLFNSLIERLEQAERAKDRGNLNEASEILNAIRHELIARLQRAGVGRGAQPEISPDCAGSILSVTTDVLNLLLQDRTGYIVLPHVLLYASGGIWPTPPQRFGRREVRDTVRILSIAGADRVGRITLPRMRVIGYPGPATLERHVSDRGIHFEEMPRLPDEGIRLRLSLGNVTTDDIPEGAQLEQEIRIDGNLVAIVRVVIPPQRLIQVIMGEAGGNIGLELQGSGGRSTVLNNHDQVLSPSSTGVAWTIKNRVQAILTRDFRTGYFAATAPSYAGVITEGQFDGIRRNIATRSISRSSLERYVEENPGQNGRLIQEYDLAVETAATVFGDGLMFNRLAIPRGAAVARDDRIYWFFSTPQSGVTTIENALADGRIGSAGPLKPRIPAYPLPEGSPAQIVLYRNIPIAIHGVDNRGFAFVRTMVDQTTELTILSGGTIDGNGP